jgi:hypothetical protein
VPVAHGIHRLEVCLPERVCRELSTEQQETILAHESAHLLRRDPAWLMLYRIVEALLFAQPLNRVARRRLQEIAEFRCDDWAVERTGRPITLAKCLTEVAGWRVSAATLRVAPTMAGGRSRLSHRVKRLMARDYPRPEHRSPKWLAPVVAAVTLAVALGAPGIVPASAEPTQPAPPPPPAAAEPSEPAPPSEPPAPSDPESAPVVYRGIILGPTELPPAPATVVPALPSVGPPPPAEAAPPAETVRPAPARPPAPAAPPVPAVFAMPVLAGEPAWECQERATRLEIRREELERRELLQRVRDEAARMNAERMEQTREALERQREELREVTRRDLENVRRELARTREELAHRLEEARAAARAEGLTWSPVVPGELGEGGNANCPRDQP